MTDKISVYGSTGFIGGTFCNLFPRDIIKITRDSRTPESDQILYFISTTSNQSVFKDLHIDVNTNLNLLMDVLEQCKEKNITFNFISSGFVYGNDVVDAKETDCCNPTGFYSITKRCAEQLLISFCNTFGINYRILRIGNVYGVDKTISPGKNVLGYMIELLKKDQDIKLYDDGFFLKDYMFVDDICRAIKCVIDCSEVNQIYNICSGESVVFGEIISKAKEMIGSKSNLIGVPIPEEQKFIQVKNMTLNNKKLKDLDFTSTINFDQGLKLLIQNLV